MKCSCLNKFRCFYLWSYWFVAIGLVWYVWLQTMIVNYESSDDRYDLLFWWNELHCVIGILWHKVNILIPTWFFLVSTTSFMSKVFMSLRGLDEPNTREKVSPGSTSSFFLADFISWISLASSRNSDKIMAEQPNIMTQYNIQYNI